MRLRVVAQALVSTRAEYDHLFSIYVPIAIGVFLAIVVIVVAALFMFKRRPAERAARWHENNPVEATYAVALGCVAAFLLYLTFTTEHKVDTSPDRIAPEPTEPPVGTVPGREFED